MLAGCLVGACVGFLWFNAFPATIFMGDTGSLGLGGAIAGLAVMTKTEVLLILLGGIFVIEALSVLIQVISFQLRRKRVFLMAPIHHHFELRGVVGDEDHPALLDRRRDLLRDRLHDLPPEHRLRPRRRTRRDEARPPLPGGPYLVVGLARSGIGRGAGPARARRAGHRRATRRPRRARQRSSRGQRGRAAPRRTTASAHAGRACGLRRQEPRRARQQAAVVAAARAAG